MSSRISPRLAAVLGLAIGGTTLALAGCAQHADLASQSAPTEAPAFSLRLADADEYQRAVARHRSQVVLVDFWATWCLPCVEQFPHTVALHRQYHDRGLAVIGVSLNEPDAEPQVREFLESQQARFDNLLSSYERGTQAVEAFNLPGPVPYYRVYDRTGKLRHEFAVDPRAERQFTQEDIEAAIMELL